MLVLVAVATAFMVSCNSSKPASSSYSEAVVGKPVELPCSGVNRSDANYFRQLGVGKDTEIFHAQENALKNAKSLLLERLGGMVVGLSTDYRKTYKASGKNDQLGGILERELTTVVEQALDNADNACEQATSLPTGEVQYFYVIEVRKQELASKMAAAITDNDKLRTEFDREQFRQYAEEYMKKRK